VVSRRLFWQHATTKPWTEACIDDPSSENQPGAPPPGPADSSTAKAGNEKTRMYFQSLRYSYIGLFFGVAVVLGYGVGSALDRRFHTGTWLTMVGVLFGIASGFSELLRMARRYQKELARDAENKPKQG
jgi:F0F1-type ATP synthase assembly protein I